jgi:hypothetical protein
MFLVLGLWSSLAAAASSAGEPLWTHFQRSSELVPGAEISIILVRLDVDGDGRDEILLAHSQTCGNGGCWWFVYSPVGKTTVRYLGDVGFHLGFYRLGGRILSTCSHILACA